jgi:hypothetical protein
VHRILLPASLALLLALTGAVAAAPAWAQGGTPGLVNGSFEPDFGAPPVGVTIPGWTARGAGVTWSTAGEGEAAPAGDWMVALASGADGPASLAQEFATVPGESYDLAFWLGGRGHAALRVQVAGVERTLAIANAAPELLWQPHVLSFTATSAATRLVFRAADGRRGAPAWLDGVVVRPPARPRP